MAASPFVLPPIVPLDPDVAADPARAAAPIIAWLREVALLRHVTNALRSAQHQSFDMTFSPAAFAGIDPAIADALQSLFSLQRHPTGLGFRPMAAQEAEQVTHLLSDRRDALLAHLSVAGATAPGAATVTAIDAMGYASLPSWSDEIHPPIILLLGSLRTGQLTAAAFLRALGTWRLRQSFIDGVTRAVAGPPSQTAPLMQLRTIGLVDHDAPFARFLGDLLALPPAGSTKAAQALAHRVRDAVAETLVRLSKGSYPRAADVAATLLADHVLATPTVAAPWTPIEVTSLPWLDSSRPPTTHEVDAFAARLEIPPYRARMGARKELPFLQAIRRLLSHPATAWYAMPVLCARATTPATQCTLFFQTCAVTYAGPWVLDDPWVSQVFACVASLPDDFIPSDEFARLGDLIRRHFGRGDPDDYLRALLRWEQLTNPNMTLAEDLLQAMCAHPTWKPTQESLSLLLMSPRASRRQMAHTIIASCPDASAPVPGATDPAPDPAPDPTRVSLSPRRLTP